MPENANQLLRLARLAVAVVNLAPDNDLPLISPGRWRQLTNQPPLATEHMLRMEDPFNDISIEELTLRLGSFRVSSGLSECAVFQLRQLLVGLANTDCNIDLTIRSEVLRQGIAACVASDCLWKRVGLTRGTHAGGLHRGAITVPPVERLRELMEAVSLPIDELQLALESVDLGLDDLAPLTTQLGNTASASFDGTVLQRPLLRHGDRLIIVSPASLIPSAVEAIIRRLLSAGHRQALADLYSDEGMSCVRRSLGMLHWHELVGPPTAIAVPGARDAFFDYDTDKLAYVVLLSEDFEGYDSGELWNLNDLSGEIVSRLREIEEFVFAQGTRWNELFHVIVTQGSSRASMLMVPDDVSPSGSSVLTMSPHDLEVIAMLEPARHLRLWRWSRDRDRAWSSGTVIRAWNPLDEYAVYRGHGYSYYLSDDAKPSYVSADLFGVGVLKEELVDKYDPHGVQLPELAGWKEVVRLASQSALPVYIPADLAAPPSLVVELDTPIWITASNELSSDLQENYVHFAHIVAFWLATMGPKLTPALRSIGHGMQPLAIRLLIPPSRGWLEPDAIRGDTENALSVVIHHNAIEVEIRDGMVRLLMSEGNVAERELVRAVLVGIDKMARIRGGQGGD